MGNVCRSPVPKPDMLDISIELKMQAKMIDKQSLILKREAEKNVYCAKKETDPDRQVMYAENAIRAKTESVRMMKFGVKVLSVSKTIESAARTMEVSETLMKSSGLI